MARPTAKPRSIGEEGTDGYRLVSETVELPPRRDLVVQEIGRILEIGLVQRLVIEVGQPIRYQRLVPREAALPDMPEEIVESDLYSEVRNQPIEDLKTTERNPYSILFRAFALVAKRGLKPKAFLVGSLENLIAWVAADDTMPSPLYGVEVHTHAEVPEDVLLLLASDGEGGDTALSVRIAMD